MPDDRPQLALVREAVQAMQRRDLNWLVEHSTDDVELRPFMWTDLPFHGADGLATFVNEYLAVRTPLRLNVEDVRRPADPVALDVHLRGHLRGSDVGLDDHPTFVFWLREGRLARFEGHVDPVAIDEALGGSAAGSG